VLKQKVELFDSLQELINKARIRSNPNMLLIEDAMDLQQAIVNHTEWFNQKTLISMIIKRA